ncbi:receptor 12 [Olea europaea subsp. europaea]|uniref:Receptor 12 n=1 Tax=Olea europaea subsp. europaea TaxID=158383 RepID=A0A8S0QEX9_OLEEU|nr:receptor 12 [Olea europaea subsp. europaea]
MSLESLDLCGNQFFGALPDHTKFSCLRKVILCWNQLNGFLPQSLGQPSSLEVLDLGYNHISGSLPGLKVHSSLIELYLTRNQLKRLPEGIWQHSKLEIFLAASNLLEGTITEAQLSNLANLKCLDLSFNYLTLNLSSDWDPPFQLNDIFLSHCNMGPHFPKWLQTQNSYVNLDISVAGISDVVPNWFWNMSFGRYLNISHNQMRGKIPEVSKDLFPKIADLSHNNFSSPIPIFVFQSEILSISKNMFSRSIYYVCKIPNDFFASILDLSDNQLSRKLPNCWKSLTNLIILNLANNHFRGKIPNTIGALYQLQTLHLRNNNIMGKLPSSLKNCTALRMIDLGENKLTGDIPAWIGTHLTRLAGLSLRSNQFHGKISPTICHLVNIQILDLSINHISGKIPRRLNNFTSLVEKNSSIETIPIGEVFFERYVDNVLVQWKGKAIEYRKLGLLKGIDLSSNMLVGTIPQELSDMKGLIFLNLSRNHLTRNIISSIGQMEMLEWLDLSKNQLSGEIPTGLANLNYLSILDLSYNNLTGKFQ